MTHLLISTVPPKMKKKADDLKKHEFCVCVLYPINLRMKDLKPALLREVETGSLAGELTCGEESMAA